VSVFWPVLAVVAAVFGLAMLGLGIGAVFSRRCLRGSCGGPDVLGPGGRKLSCAACPNRRRPAG
jgi:hypothetical protein